MKGIKYIVYGAIYILSIVIPIIFTTETYIDFIYSCLFSLLIITGAIIDMHFYILPDEGAIGLAVLGIIYSIIHDHAAFDTCMTVLIIGCICFMLRYMSGNGLGWGDIKWFCVIAIWLTVEGNILMMYMAFCSGTLYLLLHKIYHFIFSHEWRKIEYIPFGPFLCFGGWWGLHFPNLGVDIYWYVITKFISIIGAI